jgi:hypothetical protein
MGLKMALSAINKDFETCEVICACFADIVGVFISCRLYAQLYGSDIVNEGNAEVQDQVRKGVPDMLRDILDFSFSASKFVREGELGRWLKSLVKDSKAKFEGKAKTIRDHHERLIKHADQAAHQEGTIRSRTSEKQMKQVLDILKGMQDQLDEERKSSRKKTFDGKFALLAHRHSDIPRNSKRSL